MANKTSSVIMTNWDLKILHGLQMLGATTREALLQYCAGKAWTDLKKIPKPVVDAFEGMKSTGFIKKLGKDSYVLSTDGESIVSRRGMASKASAVTAGANVVKSLVPGTVVLVQINSKVSEHGVVVDPRMALPADASNAKKANWRVVQLSSGIVKAFPLTYLTKSTEAVAYSTGSEVEDDRKAQEEFADMLRHDAKSAGFTDTKTFVILSGRTKHVVYVYFKRQGDDADVKDARAFRQDANVVTEYDPIVCKSRGISKSKLGTFKLGKLKSEIEGIYKDFVAKYESRAGVVTAADAIPDRVGNQICGDLKRISSTIKSWEKVMKSGKMTPEDFNVLKEYQTSVAKFIAKTYVPRLSPECQKKAKEIQ